jgi:acetyl esterase
MLDTQAQELLKLIVERGVPPVETQTPAEAREAYRARRLFTQPDPPPIWGVRDHTVRTAQACFQVREYQPTDRDGGPARPALLYFHGGGWTIGDLDTHDTLCRSLSLASGCVVVSVDYRMGPEHRFPAAYEDCLAAFHWTLEHADTLGINPRHVAVGGDSAGGNLAAAVCLGLRGQAITPAYQLLIYPAVDLRCVAPSHTHNGKGYLLTQDSIAWFVGNYLASSHDANDWRVSPLLAPSHADLPPALVLTAGFDPLRDEGLQYADALSQAGVPTEYICFERQIHGFITMGRVLRESATAVSLCAHSLRRALG